MIDQHFHAEILDRQRGAAVLVPFEGWIGRARGRFFILVDGAMQARVGTKVSAMVQVVVRPRG